MKTCPFCAEQIQDQAVKCRYCGEWLSTKANQELPEIKPEIDSVEAKEDKVEELVLDKKELQKLFEFYKDMPAEKLREIKYSYVPEDYTPEAGASTFLCKLLLCFQTHPPTRRENTPASCATVVPN